MGGPLLNAVPASIAFLMARYRTQGMVQVHGDKNDIASPHMEMGSSRLGTINNGIKMEDGDGNGDVDQGPRVWIQTHGLEWKW